MKKTRWFILGLTAVICVAVFVNWRYFRDNAPADGDSQVQNTDGDGETGDSSQANAPLTDSYFDTARYSRKKSRDDAVAALNALISNDDAEEYAKQAAYAEITSYARLTETETTLESLIKSKGFEDCIVFLTPDTASVVIGCESLTAQQAVQICDLVTGQTALSPDVIKIIPYS